MVDSPVSGWEKSGFVLGLVPHRWEIGSPQIDLFGEAFMAILIYKVIHLSGIFMIILSLGGVLVHVINGGDKKENAFRKGAMITHGIGMFLALLGGFGMLARLSIHWPWPGWVWVKFIIWIVLGGLVGVIYRKPNAGKMIWILTLVLGAVAAYMALFKPF